MTATPIQSPYRITLNWSAPLNDGGADIKNYKIWRGTSSGIVTLIATIGNVLTYDDTNYASGVTYYYKVSAVNGVGGSPLSNEVSARGGANNRVFITSANYQGNLGSVGGADSKCQAAANSRLLGGTWKAWVSDPSNLAVNR